MTQFRAPVLLYPFLKNTKWTHSKKGKHLSTAQREMTFSYCNSGKTARECHDVLFLGSEQLCKLKNIQKIYRLFNDGTKEKDMVQYLANSKSRGPQLKDNNEQWYDDLVGTLNTNYPTVTTIVLRQHLEAAIGGSSTDQCVPST